jgi:hypothetical protein
MRRFPQEFESLAEVVERLEFARFSTDAAHRAVRDILRDRRYLKRLTWVDATSGAIVGHEQTHVVAAPGLDEIDWETSSFKNQLPDSRGRRIEKIEVLIADVKWYLNAAELSADVGRSVTASPSISPDVRDGPAQKAGRGKGSYQSPGLPSQKPLVKQRFAVTGNGFQHRVWPEARKLAGLQPVAPPGAKKSSHDP